MSDVMTVENTEMQIREYNGQRVVTFKDIDRVHQRTVGMSRKAFNRNKKHFVEDVDYFVHERDEAKKLYGITAPNGLTVVTETGYLMIVKTFTDDLSWSVQRQLVNNYFKNKKIQQPVPGLPEIKKYEHKVPLIPGWYDRNRGRIERLCEKYGATCKTLYHFLLKHIGEWYDLDEAREIYYKEVGHYPKYAIDIVSYFPELGEMADELLTKVDK